MNYNIEVTSHFKKQAKHLLKKYPSFKQELAALIHLLADNPRQGSPIGLNCYKIRISIESKRRGKSGGARIITHLHVTKTTLYLISIYDKSEQFNITDNEIISLLKDI